MPHKNFVRCSLVAGALGILPVSLFAAGDLQERADRFLDLVNPTYQALTTVQSEAQWSAVTDVSPEHDAGYEAASKAFNAFVGSPALINEARELLRTSDQLKPLTVLELKRVLLNAAEGPMTNPTLVANRVAAETKQASTLNSFQFKLEGKPISANGIDDILANSTNLVERRAVWETSKQSGPALKPGLIKLRDLRNGVARELGHRDYFALQVAGYGMTTGEMIKMQDDFLRDLHPLFLQLHTWAKYKMAEKYHQPVPKRIPAHWINNRWAQQWDGLVESANLDSFIAKRSPESIVKTAEQFYTGLGFAPLPATFWTKSDLYPVPAGDPRKKNTHASCWHIDLDKDIRSLQSIEANEQWFETAHHELGHAYYFMSYSRPQVPILLRIGANPSFHEGVGELISLASRQAPYLKSIGVLPTDYKVDETQFLLKDALSSGVAFLYFASGTMAHWEADVYSGNLPADQWNARWWKYVEQFQGVEPPANRGEEWCDAATKTHINDTPCYYYSYAIATVLKFQLHAYIAKNILHQPPQSCNYANNKEAGAFLKKILEKGGTEDWRKILRDATGEDLSTHAMVEYFAPLQKWLEEQNQGRQVGWD